MVRIRIMAIAFVVYALCEIYSLCSRYFVRGYHAQAGFGAAQGGAMSSLRVTFGVSSWLSMVGLVAIAVIFALAVMPTQTAYPSWIKVLGGIAVLLVLVQLVTSLVSMTTSHRIANRGFYPSSNFSRQWQGNSTGNGNTGSADSMS